MKKDKFDGVLLVSGGLDSTVLAYKLLNEKKRIIPLFINYGQHCVSTEFDRLNLVLPKIMLKDLKIINISDIYELSTSKMINESNLWQDEINANELILPYRNLLILVVASSFAETLNIKKVYSAFINSNHAKEIDCTANFFNNTSSILKEVGNISLEMPFRNLSKYDVAKLGLYLKAPIEKTFSCQVNSQIPCGACPNCVDRIEAMEKILEEI